MTPLTSAKPVSKLLAEKLARAEAVLAQEAAKGNGNGRRPGLKKSVSWKKIGLVMAMDFLMDSTPSGLWDCQPEEVAANDVKQGVDDGKMKATVQWRHPIELLIPEDKRVYDSEIPTQLFVRGKSSVEKAKQVQREKSIFGTVYLAGQLLPPNPADPEPEPPDDLSELQEIPYMLVADSKDEGSSSTSSSASSLTTSSSSSTASSPSSSCSSCSASYSSSSSSSPSPPPPASSFSSSSSATASYSSSPSSSSPPSSSSSSFSSSSYPSSYPAPSYSSYPSSSSCSSSCSSSSSFPPSPPSPVDTASLPVESSWGPPDETLRNASYRSRRQRTSDVWDEPQPPPHQPPEPQAVLRLQPPVGLGDMATPAFVRPPSPPPIRPQSPPRSRPGSSAKRPYSRSSSPPPRAASPPPRPPVPPSQFTPGVRAPVLAEPPHLANANTVFQQPPPPPPSLYPSQPSYPSSLPPAPPQPPAHLQHSQHLPPPRLSQPAYPPSPPSAPSLDLEALLSDSTLLSHLAQSIQTTASPRPLSASEKLQALISSSGPPPLPPNANDFPGDPPPPPARREGEVRRLGFSDVRYQQRDEFTRGPQRPFVDERFPPERPRAFEDFGSKNDFDGAVPPPPPLFPPPPPPRDMGPNNRRDSRPAERAPDVRDFKRMKGEPPRCKFFDSGVCRFGTQCQFLHVQRHR